jgi:hypothetical protein
MYKTYHVLECIGIVHIKLLSRSLGVATAGFVQLFMLLKDLVLDIHFLSVGIESFYVFTNKGSSTSRL